MSTYNGLEIAIIGMAGQFPGADNIDQFWDNLKHGRESISFFSDKEIREEGESENQLNEPSYVRANAYIKNKEYFDADFFGYIPAEAKLMDPQIRIFHEICWKALEDAGYASRKEDMKTGLFAGATPNNNWENYSLLANAGNQVDNYTAAQLRNVTYLCSKISYLLNLQGPSIYMNTACSTSLVSVQRACMSLLLRECNMALAGGVTITNYSKRGYLYREGMINSMDGHCRTFDAVASGTVGGEGAGVVVLKRLSDAIRDKDMIHAIIKGSAVNNDGDRKMSFTAPSIEGQSKTIAKAISMAGIEAASISYVEAHGTATKLGDPIEVEALRQAFGKNTAKHCALGSVKTNIGHLDAAAGIAGLIKTVLALKNRQLPPSLHYKTPNPEINFTDSPFYVNTQLQEWKNNQYPLRAGVSSFGIGGTNAHVVLEEAPAIGSSSPGREHQLLIVSAKSQTALKNNISSLRSYLQENTSTELADIAYTLQTGRASFAWRKVIVCKSREEAIDLLSPERAGKKVIPVTEKTRPSVVFMFSGQGSQYKDMCRDLYEEEALFREEADKCFEIIRRISGKELKQIVFANNADDNSLINNTEYTQPLLFVIEYALAQFLLKSGIRPDMLMGHSIGEYTAACIAGVFSLEDALSLVVKRGELMQGASRGLMLSVAISADKLKRLLAGQPDLSLAAINSSELCVVSGNTGAINEFKILLDKEGYKNKILQTSHAFHSSMMDGMLQAFEQEVRKIKINPARIPFISNLSGRPATDAEISDPLYWVRQLRQTVLFSEGISFLLQKSNTVFVEVGPGKTLATFVSSHQLRKEEHKVISLVRHPQESGNDLHYLLSGIGDLWVNGLAPDWNRLYEKEIRRKVSLPTYSFDRIKYPALVDAYKMISEMIVEKQVVKEQDISKWLYAPSWKLSPLVGGTSLPKNDTCTLVFADDKGVGDALIGKFEQNEEKIISVKAGACFHEASPFSYSINPGNPEEYKKLFQCLSANQLLPACIIHGWGITSEQDAAFEEGAFDRYFYSLLHTVRACQEKGGIAGKQIVVLTSGLHPVIDKKNIAADKSLSPGFLKVLSQEYPSVITIHADICLEEINDQLVNELYREVQTKKNGRTVSFRNNLRWEQIYDRIETVSEEPVNGFEKDGVYLITGGLGSLGYTIATYLVEEVKAKVILLGRTAETAERIKKLQTLGNETALYFKCDVTNAVELEKVIGSAEEKFGSLNGVIHAAGIVTDHTKSISELTPEDFEKQFAPKIKGLLALKKVLGNKKLDFCLLTSSLSAVLGGIGFGAYAAANTFMDYYMQECSELKNWQSINLDSLDLQEHSTHSINKDEIIGVLNRALTMLALPQLVISVSDLQKRLDKWVYRITAEEKRSGDMPELNDDPSFIEETGTEDQSMNKTERSLQVLWQQFFGKPVMADDDFFDIGGDSLKALTMAGRIHKATGVEIPIKEFFTLRSVREISKYINSLAGNKEQYVSIPKAAVKEYYPLSSAQKRLYFLYEFEKHSLAYNLSQVIKLDGDLDKNKLNSACCKLLARHEILRASFEVINEEPVQKIAEQVDFDVHYFHSDDHESVIQEFIRPFDLQKAPLLRIGLIESKAQEYFLVVDMHHIISDGVSQGLMIKDFMSYYKEEELPGLQLQYKDYAVWQQSAEQQEKIAAQKDFWLNEFSNEVPVLDLPADFPRPVLRSYAGNFINFEIDAAQVEKLKAIAEKEKSTLYMVILSVYYILLSKLSRQEDIVIGTPTAGRQHADLENIMGMFVNTLALRNYPKSNLRFREFLAAVRSGTLACFENQSFQYEQLIDELKIERDMGRNPLFDAMFIFQNYENVELEIPGLTLTPFTRDSTVAKFDLILTAAEADSRIFLNIDYAAELFKKETIERFIGWFRKIISAIIENTDTTISAIGIITDKEKKQVLNEFNDTAIAFDNNETVLSLFAQQVEKTPDNIAIKCSHKNISYRQLQDSSDRIATFLRESEGVGTGDLVGVMLEREEYFIPCIFGILKTGAAYIPIDPAYPTDRIHSILEDAKAKALVTRARYTNELTNIPAGVIDLDNVLPLINAAPTRSLKNKITPGDLAYVIYTSGSTGKPKGVMITHGALANVIRSMQRRYPLNDTGSFLLKTSFSFDVSCAEIFGWFLAGGSLSVLDAGKEKEPAVIAGAIEKYGVTHINFVPSMFSVFIDELENKGIEKIKSLAYIFLAGEALPADLVKRFIALGSGIQLENVYGPTEGTIYSCAYSINDNNKETVPIGKPLDNTRLYVLSPDDQLQPPGIPGELVIAGKGLASGYLNNEAMTREKFVQSPTVSGERIYKTGDLVKWLPDGNLEFLGRIDHQVKIRGFRIELGEIESRLLQYEQIKETVVTVTEKEGDKYLVAYYISGNEIERTELEKFLSGKLPEFMLPSFYIWMERFPLNASGKLDRKALPSPELEAGKDYIAPSTETEEKLAAIWAEVLKIEKEKIGVHTSFFELGGHSLKAMILVNKIGKEWATEIPLKEIFIHKTINGLAKLIGVSERSAYSAISKAAPADHYALTMTQSRLYFLHEFDKTSLVYNQPRIIKLTGTLDKERLCDAFNKLVARHEVFRTSFDTIDGYPVQLIADRIDFTIDYFIAPEKEVPSIVETIIRPFDLKRAPLIRAALITISPLEHFLVVDTHHIIMDGTSNGILVKEFAALYNNEELPPMDLHYKDYAEWKQGEEYKKNIVRQEEFWVNEFASGIPVLELPVDFPRPLIKDHHGAAIDFELSPAETKKIRSIAAGEDATLFMILLSVYNILLAKISNQDDIVIGAPIAGREHADLENLIGMFVFAHPLRNRQKGDLQYRQFLNEVKSKTLLCFQNQGYQFEAPVYDLNSERDTSHNPLFDVLFVLQNFDGFRIEIPGLSFESYSRGGAESKFDLTLTVTERPDQIFLNFEYCTALFKKETIERFIQYFKKIITVITEDTDILISGIEIIPENERQLILNKFNDNSEMPVVTKTVVDLFEEQVRRNENGKAILFKDEYLTYGQLNEKVNRLSRYLTENAGIEHEDVVAIYCSRSATMIIAMLAVLKSGAAYLPVDPDYPPARIHTMLKEARVKTVLSDLEDHDLVASVADVIDLNRIAGIISIYPVDNPAVKITATDLAYILYTSGSTGKPKGIQTEHRSLVDYAMTFRDYYAITPSDKIIQQSSLSFDVSIEEIFPALISGALIIVMPEGAFDIDYMRQTIREEEVTVLSTSPLVLNELNNYPDELASLRVIISGGDVLLPGYINKLVDRYAVYNTYGPTESTVCITYNSIKKLSDTKLIGKPIRNRNVFILNPQGGLCPVLLKGEICVSGEGLARGYVNDEKLTKEKFADNPYLPGQRMYRTGDYGRWLPDGNIEFLGRQDEQIKIRGFRIELGEIETQLAGYDRIKKCVVAVKEKENTKYLVAYYVSDEELVAHAIRSYLETKLPGYMVPSYYMPIGKLPLTSNGKLNRKALPDPEITAGNDYAAPSNDIEEELLDIWSAVLLVEKSRISVNKSFFYLGGHSMNAMNLANRITHHFNLKISLKIIFSRPTIQLMADYIKTNLWLGQDVSQEDIVRIEF